MISSEDRDLGLLSTRLCKHVVFIWKAIILQSMKEMATNVYSSIGADPVPLIRWAISEILLPNF